MSCLFNPNPKTNDADLKGIVALLLLLIKSFCSFGIMIVKYFSLNNEEIYFRSRVSIGNKRQNGLSNSIHLRMTFSLIEYGGLSII